MNDKELVEKATIDAFVALHNQKYGTAYAVSEYGDNGGDRPDAVCVTANGELFYTEITLTEDRPGDIPWMLGRTDSRPHQGITGSCLQDNVLAELTKRLTKKTSMRYGGQTALVIRDTSGVDWDWEDVRLQVQDLLQKTGNPFCLGIWVVNRAKTRLCRISPGLYAGQ